MAAKTEPRVKFQADPNCECRRLQAGFTWVIDKDGDRVIGRCPCFKRHQGYATTDHKSMAAGE